MLDAAVEGGEKGGGFGANHGGFEVGAGEVADGFEVGFVIHVENNQGRGRLRKGSGKNDFATFASFVCKAQVLLAEWRAAIDKTIHNFVEQRVIVHGLSPIILNESRVAEIAA